MIVSVNGEWVNLVMASVYGEWVNLVMVSVHREWVNLVIVGTWFHEHPYFSDSDILSLF